MALLGSPLDGAEHDVLGDGGHSVNPAPVKSGSATKAEDLVACASDELHHVVDERQRRSVSAEGLDEVVDPGGRGRGDLSQRRG